MSSMSKEDQISKRNYAEEIGLESVPMSVARNVAQLCWYDRHVPMFISVSGIGKTAVMKQLSRAHDMDCVIFSLAHCEPSDITGPMWPAGDDSYTHLRNGRIPIEGEDDRAMLFFDEPNRADMPTLNAVFPAWAERRLGGHKLGRNVVVAAAMNPPGGDYAVTSQFSSDPAMRRRTCQIAVHFSFKEFTRWAQDPAVSFTLDDRFPKLEFDEDYEAQRRGRPMHAAVVEFLLGNPDLALDEKSREAGKVYGCPATWEAVSDTFYTIEHLELETGDPIVQRTVTTKLGGHVGFKIANDIWDYYVKNAAVIDPMALLTDYEEGTHVWRQVQNMLRRGDAGQLQNIVNQAGHIWGHTPDLDDKKVAPCVARFLDDVPATVATTYMQALAKGDMEANGDSTSKRSMSLGAELHKYESFKKFRSRRNDSIEEGKAKRRELKDQNEES